MRFNLAHLVFVAVLVATFVAVPRADGEFRTWTDKKGNKIEAELVGAFGNKITLRDKNGRVMKIDPAGLSNADQLYWNPPPTLEDQYAINFGKSSWQNATESQRNGMPGERQTEWEFGLRLKKRMPGAPDLTGASGFEFAYGEQTDRDQADAQLIVLDIFEVPVKWETPEKGSAVGGRVMMTWEVDDDGKRVSGTRFKGYFTALISMEGEVLLYSCSNEFLNNIEKLRLLKKGDKFTKELQKVEG